MNDLPVIVVGAGRHAKVVIDALKSCGRKVICAIEVDQQKLGTEILGVSVRDENSVLKMYSSASIELANGVGSIDVPIARKKIYSSFKKAGFTFATIIHPTAMIADSVYLEEGAQVMMGAVLQSGVRIDANGLVNTGAQLDHDCWVGEHSHIAPGVTLSGSVRVGACSHIGTASVVIQLVTIGERAMVGAGSVLLSDIPAGGRYAGYPAEPMVPSKRSTEAEH